jgi:hypothetical protein
MARPRAESSMRAASRRCLVSSFFALITHQLAVRWYQGGWDRKNSHALRFRLSSSSSGAGSLARSRYSYA